MKRKYIKNIFEKCPANINCLNCDKNIESERHRKDRWDMYYCSCGFNIDTNVAEICRYITINNTKYVLFWHFMNCQEIDRVNFNNLCVSLHKFDFGELCKLPKSTPINISKDYY